MLDRNAARYHRKTDPLDAKSRDLRVRVLLAEYDHLYGLVLYRMTSIERRVPVAAAMTAGMLGGVTVLPEHAQMLFLLALPVSTTLFMKTAVGHARSFEDVLRRIEEIEGAVNALCGETLIGFQSRHPSRGRTTGGRTGTESVRSMLAVCLMTLAAGLLLFVRLGPGIPLALAWPVLAALAAADQIARVVALARYTWRDAKQVRLYRGE